MNSSLRPISLLSLLTLTACSSAPADHADADTMAADYAAHQHKLEAQAVQASHSTGEFTTFEEGGRLWVFKTDSPELAQFLATGEPAKSVTQIGAGPGGQTLRGPDSDTLLAFRYTKPGYYVDVVEGRLWVFRTDSEPLAEYLATGEPAKSVTQIGAGPDGRTLRGAEDEVLSNYMLAKHGFTTVVQDGVGWVFRNHSKARTDFEQHGEPAKSITYIGEGPNGISLRGPDEETLIAYLYTKPGFWVDVVDGRVWIFASGSEEQAEYERTGEPAKSITRIGAGPDGRTLRGPDNETLDAWLGA